MQITILLHMGQHSISLIFDIPFWMPLVMMVAAATLIWIPLPKRTT